jgi:hypothetical protein
MLIRLKDRVRERTMDVLDWMDYRPDPHWWQFLAVPAVLAVAWFLTPMEMGPLMVIATVVTTLSLLAIWLIALVVVVAWRAIRDVIQDMLRRRRSVYGTRPLGYRR